MRWREMGRERPTGGGQAMRSYKRDKNIDLHATKKFVVIKWLIILFVGQVQTQVRGVPRFPYQPHFEDSAHVFFTAYPNPFSPPTVRDTGKGLICGGGQFYCDLSESARIAFVDENDSTVYTTTVKSSTPPQFSFCYWLAGPRVRKELLPSKYIRSDVDMELKTLIIVRGRRKCLAEHGMFIQKGWYYWIDEQVTKKR